METYVADYEVNAQTMAILPVAHLTYQSVVYERGREIHTNKTPIQLIHHACLEGGSTYEGRRQSVIYHFGAKQKTPIPISPSQNIFAFPTESPDNFNCKWLFYPHILSIKPNHHPNKTTQQTIITFKNGQELLVKESYYLLEKQMSRTAKSMVHFSTLPMKTLY